MDDKKRDRSEAGQWAAAVAAQQKATERLQRLSDEKARRAEGRAKGELRDLGTAALTAALGDYEFRAKLITAANGKVLSDQKIVELALTGKLLTHLETMPGPSVEPTQRPTVPNITVETSHANHVVRYTELRLRAMSNEDVNDVILISLGAIYIDEIKRWACSHPDFIKAMKSINRDVDRRLDGLQPDLASRYLTTVHLEKAIDTSSNLSRLEVLVEWEDLASSDGWAPEHPDPHYAFTPCSQDNDHSVPRLFDCLKEISEAEREFEYWREIEDWDGTWSLGARAVPVVEVRQAIVFSTWGERTSEARTRLAKGESARDEWQSLNKKRMEAEMLSEQKQYVAAAMVQRRSKYGDKN